MLGDVDICIRYRSLLKEVKNFVFSRIKFHLSEFDMQKYYNFLQKQFKKGPLFSVNVDHFATFGVLKLNPLDVSKWDTLFEPDQTDTKLKLLDIVSLIEKVFTSMLLLIKRNAKQLQMTKLCLLIKNLSF